MKALIRCIKRLTALIPPATLLIAATMAQASARRPNIIFILCDDLGFGDIGPTFQNQRAALNDPGVPAFSTPHLDVFAAEGLMLRNHYCAAPVCAPSRASLLLGVTQGHANVRNNQFDKALANNHTLGTVLKQAGYATAAFGKWGLQGRADGKPNRPGDRSTETQGGNPRLWRGYPTKHGFDDYYGYVRHRDGHYHYPKEDGRELWENDREVSAGLDRCYTADLFTARAKKWIVDQRATNPNQPFFVYLAYDTPHAKLQYPPCAYPEGGGLKGGVQWTGETGAMINTATGTVDGWCDPTVAGATWDHDRDPSTPEIAWPEVQKRYATVVRRLDQAVGDLIQLLKDLGIDHDTLVVFTSDNGPSKESYLKHRPYHPNFFHGFGPFDGIKRDTLEGGVREPTLVRWPGHVPAGGISRRPSGMWDWLPTFAELAGLPAPAASDGVSLVPTLTGAGVQRPSTIYIEYFHQGKTPGYPEFLPAHRGRVRGQMQLVWVDGYTGLRYNVKSAEDDFEIYDVEKDPREGHNLAGTPDFASLQLRMKARALQVRRPNPSASRPFDLGLVASRAPARLRKGQLRCDVFHGPWPWVPEFRTLKAEATEWVQAVRLDRLPLGNNIGAAFHGLFHAPVDGEYTFYLKSDGGAELFLHQARVIDDDFRHTGAEVSGAIRLAAGWHPLRLYYRHEKGGRELEFHYSGPSIPYQAVPPSALAVDGSPSG